VTASPGAIQRGWRDALRSNGICK